MTTHTSLSRLPHLAAAIVASLLTACSLATARPGAQPVQPAPAAARQSPTDAWWTGPMLANSAATLPRGHYLLEPYLYDVAVRGQYDQNGVRRSTSHADGFGSQTYALYGLADRLSVGMIPTFGFNTTSTGPHSTSIGVGDVGLAAQYRFTATDPYSPVPTISVNVQENFPTGRYDRLDSRPSDGFGSGVYTTTLSLYSQKYLWLPTGRILRLRVNASQGFSSVARLEDASVYGTAAGFRGTASPGQTTFVDAAGEYSLTRGWVLALDATYRHARDTRVAGYSILDPAGANGPAILTTSAPSDAVGLAPAVEYSWTPNVGVLLGTRVIVAGRNTSLSVSPAIAINFVH